MRAVHGLSIVAVLALGLGAAGTAEAQGLLHASPPAEGAGQVGTPPYDDMKIQTGTALPPKVGTLAVFSRSRPKQLLAVTAGGRPLARRVRAK
jgi:hypothetical protein